MLEFPYAVQNLQALAPPAAHFDVLVGLKQLAHLLALEVALQTLQKWARVEMVGAELKVVGLSHFELAHTMVFEGSEDDKRTLVLRVLGRAVKQGI